MMGTSVGWKESHTVANYSASKNETMKVYEFWKRVCKKTMGASVQQLQAQRQPDNQQLTAALSPGDWMLFESPQLDDEPLWLGRTVSNPAWGNACVWKNETTRTEHTPSEAHIKPNEYAINVQWYTKKTVGSPVLE